MFCNDYISVRLNQIKQLFSSRAIVWFFVSHNNTPRFYFLANQGIKCSFNSLVNGASKMNDMFHYMLFKRSPLGIINRLKSMGNPFQSRH